jgi:hypothetical protein
MAGGDEQVAPFVFARYMIDMYFRKIAYGAIPSDEIVPCILAVNAGDVEKPWVL